MLLHLLHVHHHRVLHILLILLLPLLLPRFSCAAPSSCAVPPSDAHSTCLNGHALPCSGHGVCTEGVCLCDGDWMGKNCDANAVTSTSFLEPPPSLHAACIGNVWRTKASAAFIADIEQLHHPSRCHPSTALLHKNLETRQGLGAMMLFAVGAMTMSMQRDMAAVCVGQFFYDSWGACKQRPDFEPPLLCLFEPVWGCTSSALTAAANGSGSVTGLDGAAAVQELTSFDTSAYEVCTVGLLVASSHFTAAQVVQRHAALGYFWQQAVLLSSAPPCPNSYSPTTNSHPIAPSSQLFHAPPRCRPQQAGRCQARPGFSAWLYRSARASR